MPQGLKPLKSLATHDTAEAVALSKPFYEMASCVIIAASASREELHQEHAAQKSAHMCPEGNACGTASVI